MLPLEQPPEQICILRLSALGDATHVVPVVRALQDQWPATGISWIIGKLEHQLLRGLEGVEFVEFDKRGGWAAIRELRNHLSGRRFDVLLHMQVSARANLLSKMVRAPVRLGWDPGRARDFHQMFVRQHIAAMPFQHQVEGFLEFPRALGIAVARPRWDLPVSAAAEQWAQARLPSDRPVLLISPCSSHPLRNWRAEYYAAIADYAAAEMGMQPVLSGGPGELERQVGQDIEVYMESPCLNLIGKDTLEQSKALLKRADLLISPDSGPAHIASALATPVIGLYAATWSKRSGPYNSLELCVDRFEEAARKYRQRKASDLRWGTRIEVPGVMDLIRPADVIERLQAWQTSRTGTKRAR
ncbi:MAG: glycosyltransferase family 9 protein [Xanthomonadales bacterium]|nr:glycosyltransferase family 9 protein [Xanthomonadales bacterium]